MKIHNISSIYNIICNRNNNNNNNWHKEVYKLLDYRQRELEYKLL
jgi:hypothetical protein